MLQLAATLSFPALMVFAGISDLFTMTISNRVSLALALLFIPLSYFSGMPTLVMGLSLACGFGVLILTFGMFAFGWIGGGDAKLAAATVIWVGWEHLGEYAIYAALVGGALTLAVLQLRKRPLPAWALVPHWLTRLHDRNEGVPYGIALAAAGLLVFPQTSLWTALATGA